MSGTLSSCAACNERDVVLPAWWHASRVLAGQGLHVRLYSMESGDTADLSARTSCVLELQA